MTESEALTKWCPFARVSHGGEGTAYNRVMIDGSDDAEIAASDALCLCIGQKCMAWSWTGDMMMHGRCGMVRQ